MNYTTYDLIEDDIYAHPNVIKSILKSLGLYGVLTKEEFEDLSYNTTLPTELRDKVNNVVNQFEYYLEDGTPYKGATTTTKVDYGIGITEFWGVAQDHSDMVYYVCTIDDEPLYDKYLRELFERG